jgi:hypothetical protein
MTTAKTVPNDWKELAGAFRKSARRLQSGKASDNAGLIQLLIVQSRHRPAEGALLQELLCAAESQEAGGDRSAAIEHLRAAIDLCLAVAGRTRRRVTRKKQGSG